MRENVFEAARSTGASVADLSSAGVFGTFDAVHPESLTLYGVTKLAVEGIARVYAADCGVGSVGLRPYVVYGPGESSGISAGPSIAIHGVAATGAGDDPFLWSRRLGLRGRRRTIAGRSDNAADQGRESAGDGGRHARDGRFQSCTRHPNWLE
ncbi:NAD-dependent epimerase/dehydratase family protein [Sinorhizobium sp. 7-81]|uniref:NAD-dependent epimerase/dehydratase family protein n=1 Tax=Sinorhizobium sp. 7-81 TaxID=3049087 RepID=UPI0034DF3CA0